MVTGAIDTIELKQNRKMWRFCSFYTKSDPILNYMTNKLNVRTGDKILEPCAGNGDFINKLLDFNNQFNFSIDAVDLNDKSILNLKDIFNNKTNIYIRKTDTLLDEVFDFYAGMGGAYDKVIGNPPYGAYQNFERRKILKAKYTGYVRETYTLFLKRCITLLKENGKLVFIIPDTFLALHLHKNTREYLLKETSIDEILLIPTKFFPDVDFRYSDLCIITLTKKKSDNNHNIKIVSVDNSVEILSELAINDYRNVTSVQTIKQKSISESKDYSFLLGSNSNLRNLINNHDLFLGDIANCVTGFYSGDNKKFVFVDNIGIKGSMKHTLVNKRLVDFSKPTNLLLNGLPGKYKYIPYLKGGGNHIIKPIEWYVAWDKETVAFYKTDSKARFQNSNYYFRQGIGVPMVKSKKLKAFLLNKRLFDQSIVGIFPKEEKYLYFLLGFLNSSVCSRIIHTINHTANNSANYLKKIPIIYKEKESSLIEKELKNYINEKKQSLIETLRNIDQIVNSLYEGKF